MQVSNLLIIINSVIKILSNFFSFVLINLISDVGKCSLISFVQAVLK